MTAKEIIKLAVFQGKQIRKIIHDGEWWFSVIDVVGVLSDSDNPRDYWYRIKQREKISGTELSTICRQLKLAAPDGRVITVWECELREPDNRAARLGEIGNRDFKGRKP